MLYYTVTTHEIISRRTYLLSYTKPAGDPIRRSRNTHLTTRAVDETVVPEITRTIDSLVLDFCVCAIYTYPNMFLCSQVNWGGITRLIGSEAGIVHPDQTTAVPTITAASQHFGRQRDRTVDSTFARHVVLTRLTYKRRNEL